MVVGEATGSGAPDAETWRGGYTSRSRFRDDEPAQSNPEELIAAGHAGCFLLALANNLETEGYDPERVDTSAECHLEMIDDQGPTTTRIEPTTEAAIPEINEPEFRDIAEDAKNNCPVSRALSGVDITLDASGDT
jgi:osmotically inducible protein OsmC